MPSRPKRLSTLLDAGRGERAATPGLKTLLRRADNLQRLNRRVCAALPEPLATHVRVSNVRDGRVVMTADSAAWGTRLRYFRAAVLENVTRTMGEAAYKLDIRVNPRERMTLPPRRPQPMSPEAARNIAATAGHIEDPELAASLRRLAGRAKGRS